MRWGPSPAPPGLWPVIHSGEAQEKLGAPGNPQSQGFRSSETDPSPGWGQWQVSHPRWTAGMGHRLQRPARSFHHFHPGLFKQKAGRKPFSSVVEDIPSCSHLTEWDGGGGVELSDLQAVVTFLASLGIPAPICTFTPPPWPLSTRSASAHPRARSRLPVTSTREDKWPHSGTPCQICLRQSCAQHCVKNGSQPPSEQAGLVGANCRGFVNACWLPPETAGRRVLALEMPGCPPGRLVKARDRLPPGHQPPPPHLSSAELGCRGGTWLPSSCSAASALQVRSCSGKGSGFHHPAPGNRLAVNSV